MRFRTHSQLIISWDWCSCKIPYLYETIRYMTVPWV